MREWTCGLVVAIGLVATAGTASGQTDPAEPTARQLPRVRSSHPAIAELIVRAGEQSSTFRQMVETITASDGTVYVEQGMCKAAGVRACLVKVTSAGPRRYVFVKVDIENADREPMVLIGHELRHAIEVLSNPRVTDRASLYFFYKVHADRSTPGAFETYAAIEAGDAVASEIRRFQRTNSGRR